LRFHPDKEAAILVPQMLERKCSGLFPSHSGENIFSKVFFFDWNANPPEGARSKKIEEISKQMEEWFGEEPLSKFEEINVCRSSYYFGIWIVEKKQPYNWFEDADGKLSRAEIFKNTADKRTNPMRFEWADELGNYTGDNPYVLKKFVNLSAQLPDFYDPLAVDFNIVEEIKKLSSDKKKLLLKFFDTPESFSFGNNSALFLTQHFANVKMLTYEEQALIYQLTCDYYLSSYDLYFKWHPTDITPYTSFMDNVTMIPGNFPSELLVILVDTKFKVCASIESSGTLNLSSICDRILLFNMEYITTTFKHNHRYYFSAKLLETLPDYPVCAIGFNQIHMNNLLEFSDVNVKNQITYTQSFTEVEPCSVARIYLIGSCGDVSIETLDAFYASCFEQDILVFLNIDAENYFWPIRNTVPYLVKEIRFRAIDQETYGKSEGCERIFIFTRNQSAMKEVKQMKYVKQLLQTGVETAVFASSDKDVQIAALSGMLKATEAQLDKYIAENRELKKKLNSAKP